MKKNTIETIRHSLAHILAMAVLEFWPDAKLGIGPAIENGFYYDFLITGNFTIDDLEKIEAKMKEIIRKDLKFIKKEILIEEAKKIFKNQSFKLKLINELKKENEKKVSVYKTADFTDLCKGPHVNSTKDLDPSSFKLVNIAGAYWKGDEKNPQLQRIYGIAFETKKELKEYLRLQKEMEKRDHRKIGQKMDLFSFQDIAPGAPFWHPKGMTIVKELEKYWRKIHDKNGYQEISTPIMVKKEVFEKSGHWQYYRENMFYFKWENEIFALKPMNCPESTYVYASRTRSYRDLPLRFSEIGRLHRNELSGTLGGLFRVRQLTMDDAHVYLREDQMQNEITAILKLIKNFYNLFDFKPSFHLATKPDEALGDSKLWQKAETALKLSLQKNKLKFEVKPKDGAFYGPKIDIYAKDALKRNWQLATIQIDFNLARNFDLYYTDKNGKKIMPIVIHRAIFGSFERFIGILLEHYAGALPFWLSPLQIAVLAINDKKENMKYAESATNDLKKNGIRAWLDNRNESVSKKIREAEIQKIPYLLIIGDKETKSRTVSVRERGKGDIGPEKFDNFLKKIKNLLPKD
jgi:threonyl-tRNA synthetase